MLGSSQVHCQPYEVERLPAVSPEVRLANVSNIKLLGGALAAGAGLSLIKNYWNKPSPAPSSSSYYYRPGYSQHYYSNNRYPTFYHQPATHNYPTQNQQYYSNYAPSSLYYVKPYTSHGQNLQYNQHPAQQQNYNNPYQQQYSNSPQYPQQQHHNNHQEPHSQQQYNQSWLEQRIMEDEGLYTIGLMELPAQSRKIKKLLAGGAGLAAGYYLANKYNQYKNSGYNSGYNKYSNKYFSSKPKYPYQVYRPQQYPYQYQPLYKPTFQSSYRPPQYHPSYRPFSSKFSTSYQGRADLPTDSTCVPVLAFSYQGNHLYKCRGL